jgi:hypothetical protein
MAGAPIKLGSAAAGGLVFQTGSRITTDEQGIQRADIIALYGGGGIPSLARGTPYNEVFDNGFLPGSFVLDSLDIEFLPAKALSGTIVFKRTDPAQSGRTKATISVDSVVNYKSILSGSFYPTPFIGVPASGDPNLNVIGFPEPIVTVSYNSSSMPRIARGVNGLYATPDEPAAAGFPVLSDIRVRFEIRLSAGAAGQYWNGTAFIAFGPLTVDSIFQFRFMFSANPLGWQLQKLKWDPVGNPGAPAAYGIEEQWRGLYFFTGVEFIRVVPA